MITRAMDAEIIVRKSFDRFEFVKAPKCSPTVTLHSLKRDINGNCFYEVREQRNTKEYVNSYRAGASLSSLLARVGLLPVREQVAYLHQTDGVSADLSNMPTDGTSAFIFAQKALRDYPEVFERIARGESFDAVVADVFGKKVQTEKQDHNSSNVENDQKEDK